MSYDAVRLELVKNAIGSVVDEMVLTVVRIAYSSIMKDTMDLSSAFCDRSGRMIAQGLSLPLHLGSIPDAMQAVIGKYGNDIAPGDVVVLNDPYEAGGIIFRTSSWLSRKNVVRRAAALDALSCSAGCCSYSQGRSRRIRPRCWRGDSESLTRLARASEEPEDDLAFEFQRDVIRRSCASVD